MIVLPFPPSSLSGHAKGNWRSKSDPTRQWRSLARTEAILAKVKAPLDGDIRLRVTFVPPNNASGDRINWPNRCKPIFDGIADALGVNDKRFCIPEYHVAEPKKPGRVVVEILA